MHGKIEMNEIKHLAKKRQRSEWSDVFKLLFFREESLLFSLN